MPRTCQIVFGGIGVSDQDLLPVVNCDDGAYDLLDVEGTPEEIGKAIANALRDGDLFRGRGPGIVDGGGELFLTVKIKFSARVAEEV